VVKVDSSRAIVQAVQSEAAVQVIQSQSITQVMQSEAMTQAFQSQSIVQSLAMEVAISNAPIIINNTPMAILVRCNSVGELLATNVQEAIAELDADINSIGDLSTLFQNKLI
jgi:hypothetical protein